MYALNTGENMAEKTAGQTLLENAYKLASPQDNSEYYDKIAASYDADFAEALGWRTPAAIVAAYRENASETDLPIADIGCGTGLVASALAFPPEQVDGVDISREMLKIAETKQLYRALYNVDLTRDLTEIKNDYGAVLSAGAFTTGHLGPETLKDLLSIARAGALFVIGVKKVFFVEAGFEPVLRDLEQKTLIQGLKLVEITVYSKDGHDHSQDTAFALIFRRS